MARRATPTSSRPTRTPATALDGDMAHLSKVKRLAFDAGWMRWGWPERVGGLGGSTLLRGLPRRGADGPRPGRARHLLDDRGAGADDDRLRLARAGGDDGAAPAAGRRDVVPGLLRARHRQQPRRAGLPGRPRPTTAGGSPVRRCGRAWPSSPQRCVLLVRTGTVEDAHRGITALFVDMDIARASPSAPSRRCTGARSSARSSSTTSRCPFDRTLGDEGEGWAVAMDLLPFERSTALWHRGAYLHQRLDAPAGRPPRRAR